jgi:hypothetical protein
VTSIWDGAPIAVSGGTIVALQVRRGWFATAIFSKSDVARYVFEAGNVLAARRRRPTANSHEMHDGVKPSVDSKGTVMARRRELYGCGSTYSMWMRIEAARGRWFDVEGR